MKTDVKSNEMNFSGNPETVTYGEIQRVQRTYFNLVLFFPLHVVKTS